MPAKSMAKKTADKPDPAPYHLVGHIEGVEVDHLAPHRRNFNTWKETEANCHHW
jgi:hypothetical protein